MKDETFLNDKRINTWVKNESNRKGKCNKCGACCKYIMLSLGNNAYQMDYTKNFGKQIKIDNQIHIMIPQRCKQLTKDNKCKIHKTRPHACRQFPWPTDSTYRAIEDVCGFRFDTSQKKVLMGAD